MMFKMYGGASEQTGAWDCALIRGEGEWMSTPFLSNLAGRFQAVKRSLGWGAFVSGVFFLGSIYPKSDFYINNLPYLDLAVAFQKNCEGDWDGRDVTIHP